MDAIYRTQRHFYDLTRKYYLLGRDGLIDALAPSKDGSVIEIGCGTGRNLIVAARAWPDARFYGIDISEAMLETASDIKLPPDKIAIDTMLSAMAGAMRSLLEAGPSPATVRKAREQLVLLCQSYMTAATSKRV